MRIARSAPGRTTPAGGRRCRPWLATAGPAAAVDVPRGTGTEEGRLEGKRNRQQQRRHTNVCEPCGRWSVTEQGGNGTMRRLTSATHLRLYSLSRWAATQVGAQHSALGVRLRGRSLVVASELAGRQRRVEAYERIGFPPEVPTGHRMMRRTAPLQLREDSSAWRVGVLESGGEVRLANPPIVHPGRLHRILRLTHASRVPPAERSTAALAYDRDCTLAAALRCL